MQLHRGSLKRTPRLTVTFFLLTFVDAFTGNATVDNDFIRVDVETSSGETKSDVHMHVFPKKEVLERPTKPGGIPLNVALIMFDSTSAANFRRKMPNTLEYLTKNLDSLLMEGKPFYTLSIKYLVMQERTKINNLSATATSTLERKHMDEHGDDIIPPEDFFFGGGEGQIGVHRYKQEKSISLHYPIRTAFGRTQKRCS